MSSWSSEPPFLTLAADDEGRFLADGIPLGEVVSIVVVAPGFVETTRSLMLGEGADAHPCSGLLLERAASAVGRVLGRRGGRG